MGLLFRTICEYQNDKKARIDVDPRIKQAFQFFKTQFEYDDKKYMKRVIANRSNGKKNAKNKEIRIGTRSNRSQWSPIEIICNHWNQETDIDIVI